MIPASLGPGQRVLASLLSVLFVVAGCGGLPFFRTAAPSSAAVSPGPSGTAGPAASRSFAAGDGEDDLYVPPDPLCPAPPDPVAIPVVIASTGSRSVPLAVRSSSVTTCSASGSGPIASGGAGAPLVVASGDVIRLSLTPGWRFIDWTGWNIPGANSTNATPAGETPDHPATISLPVPGKTGSWVVGVSVWVISEDGRAVAGIEGTILVQH